MEEHKLSDEEIQQLATVLAPLIVKTVQEQHHAFWIDPQSHYDAHQEMKILVNDYKKARGILMSVFLTAVAVGAFILAALSFFKKD